MIRALYDIISTTDLVERDLKLDSFLEKYAKTLFIRYISRDGLEPPEAIQKRMKISLIEKLVEEIEIDYKTRQTFAGLEYRMTAHIFYNDVKGEN